MTGNTDSDSSTDATNGLLNRLTEQLATTPGGPRWKP